MQGTPSCEVQAVAAAGGDARGATAYLNLEPGGDCHGAPAALRALIGAGITRAVVGLRHPLHHSAGRGIAALRDAGLRVDVLGECSSDGVMAARGEDEEEGGGAGAAALEACLRVNEPLLHRVALRRPFSILK